MAKRKERILLPKEEQKCRVCGCTWNTPCEGGCWWVEEDLCSACLEKILIEKSRNKTMKEE